MQSEKSKNSFSFALFKQKQTLSNNTSLNMKVVKLTAGLLLLNTIFITSCLSDSNKKVSLNGRWEMKYAELNGQPAPMLEGMYFQFDEKNVTTNFNEATQPETSPFLFKDSKIIKESNPRVEFEVVNLSDTSLEMTTELRGYDFKLVLHPVK